MALSIRDLVMATHIIIVLCFHSMLQLEVDVPVLTPTTACTSDTHTHTYCQVLPARYPHHSTPLTRWRAWLSTAYQ